MEGSNGALPSVREKEGTLSAAICWEPYCPWQPERGALHKWFRATEREKGLGNNPAFAADTPF